MCYFQKIRRRNPRGDSNSTNCIDKISAIAFADDTDFHTNDSLFESKMKTVMNMHTANYKATRGKTQQTKILHYCWRLVHQNGNKIIEELDADLVVYRERIKHANANKSTRTLGVHLTPSLS